MAEVKSAEVIDHGDHKLHLTPGLGGYIPFAAEPQGGAEFVDIVNNAVRSAQREFFAFDAEVQRIRYNKYINEAGKNGYLRPARAKMDAAIKESEVIVERVAAQLTHDQDRFFAPPELTTDRDESRDRERRDKFSALPRDVQTHQQLQMGLGQHQDLLLALVRDPNPTFWRDRAQEQWRAVVAAKNPSQMKAF